MERGEALEKDKSGLRVMMKTKATLAKKIQNTFQQIFCKYENKSASYGPLGILIKSVETCSETLWINIPYEKKMDQFVFVNYWNIIVYQFIALCKPKLILKRKNNWHNEFESIFWFIGIYFRY